MPTDVTTAARAWVGTPYRGGQLEKGVGVDGFGLIRAVGEEAAVLEVGEAAWSAFAAYPDPGEDVVRAFLDSFLHRLGRRKPREGDVCLLASPTGQGGVQLGVRTELNRMAYLVRASTEAGRIKATGERLAKVVEHGFRPPWPGLVVRHGWYRFPGMV